MLCPRCKKPLRTVDTRTTAEALSSEADSLWYQVLLHLRNKFYTINSPTCTQVDRRRRCDLCGINVFTEEKITRWKKIKPLKRAKELKRRVWPPKETEDGNK